MLVSPRIPSATQFRVAVVVLCLAIIAWRTPSTFSNPQFWGEDVDFFYRAYFRGWRIMAEPVAGYLVAIQSVVAAIASHFPPIAAPAIYNYTAVLLTLAVTWLLTSPRLDMPYKPLLAIAVVIVPMGFEEIGTITNIQWILPLGTFALLFMRAAASRAVLVMEALLVAATAFSGPFSILLTPLFGIRSWTCADPAERRRLIVLTAVLLAGAATQSAVIAINRHAAIVDLAAVTYPWTLWITMPLTNLLSTFLIKSRSLDGTSGFAIGIAVSAAVAYLASLQPYRMQKIFMIVFGCSVSFAGMYKFRADLASQIGAQRYFYAGCVFALWFLCCVAAHRNIRHWPAAAVALLCVLLLPQIRNTPRITADLQWPAWAAQFDSGLPTITPSSPPGFYLALPATPTGPLARFASWPGGDLTRLAGNADPSVCAGVIGHLVPVEVINPQSVPDSGRVRGASGTAWDTARNAPVQLIVLVDAAGKVMGFGFPGFRPEQPGTESASSRSGWKALFYGDAAAGYAAYAVAGDGRICKLAGVFNSRTIG